MNKTQCPHCFTVYVISDEQLRTSEGMVRCGTCRERFQANLITSKYTPKFDPKRVFIEPLSQSDENNEISVDDFVKESPEIEFREETAHGESVTPQTTPQPKQGQQELNLPEAKIETNIQFVTDHTDNIRTVSQAQHTDDKRTNDEALIDQVDKLVDDKLLGSTTPNQTEPSKDLSKSPLSSKGPSVNQRPPMNRPLSTQRKASTNTNTFLLKKKSNLSIKRWLLGSSFLYLGCC